MERIDEGQPFDVYVDYAHEPRALENVLKLLRAKGYRRVIVVTGSQGGGRDKAKRAVIGRTAGAHADVVVVTNEDPYDEDPAVIIDEVAAGAIEAGKREGGDLYKVAGDRRDGIRKAISLAGEDIAADEDGGEAGRDVILLAGKGAEKFIVSEGGKKIPHDDREVAREILRDRSV
jgi:UDP-N-acetylmuramoyl-L-alanyl-D-glutamate--2,6-diaminopimelate ligase